MPAASALDIGVHIRGPEDLLPVFIQIKLSVGRLSVFFRMEGVSCCQDLISSGSSEGSPSESIYRAFWRRNQRKFKSASVSEEQIYRIVEPDVLRLEINNKLTFLIQASGTLFQSSDCIHNAAAGVLTHARFTGAFSERSAPVFLPFDQDTVSNRLKPAQKAGIIQKFIAYRHMKREPGYPEHPCHGCIGKKRITAAPLCICELFV